MLLIFVNLFLLAAVLLDRAEAADIRNVERENLITVLRNAGIELADERLLNAKPVGSVSLSRSDEAEQVMVEAVIGKDAVLANRKGNVYYYRSAKGQASFSGTGSFDINPGSGEVTANGDFTGTAAGILKRLGLECSPEPVAYEREGAMTYLTLACRREGVDIFNCTILFTFSGDSLSLIEGRRYFDTVTAADSSESIDVSTALMRFLEIIYDERAVLSTITELESGYNMISSVSGDCNLIPVWHIVTDTGEYYINGISGKQETLA